MAAGKADFPDLNIPLEFSRKKEPIF